MQVATFACSGACLISFTSASGCLTIPHATALPAAVQPQGNGYLVPIVRGFANNQILGLKEVLALGQVLGRYQGRR